MPYDYSDDDINRFVAKKVYGFPVFTEEFCSELLAELEHFELSDAPKERPNTMNNYGVRLTSEPFTTSGHNKYCHSVILKHPTYGLLITVTLALPMSLTDLFVYFIVSTTLAILPDLFKANI